MSRRWRGVQSALLAAFLLLPLLPGRASAIPAFARKYKTTCALCHSPFPRLSAFGEQFAANGFQMARGETPLDTVTTGDPMLRLQRDIPLAMRVEGYMSSRSGEGVAFDQKIPWGIKLLTGGQVTDDVAYYMYFFLTERGEIAGLEDAYLQFNDVFKTGVDIIAGQFQVSDPVFKRELRLEYEDYMPFKVTVGDVGADLTYERGLMAITSPWKDADLFVQVVNGKGLDHATESGDFDTDGTKNLGVRLSQHLGSLRVGGYFYTGKEKLEPQEDIFRIWAGDATLALGSNVELNLLYLYRTDDNPFLLTRCSQGDDRCNYGAADPLKTEVDSYMAEMIYSPEGAGGRWHFTGLYNRITSDRPVFSLGVGESGFLDNYESVGMTAHYVRARNLRFMAEFNRDIHMKANRFTAGVVTAF